MTFYGIIQNATESTLITIPTLVASGITAIICAITYAWTPKKNIFLIAFIVYLLLTLTAATLILGSGNASSPFIALWMLVSIVAGIFGLWGVITILILSSIFVSMQYISGSLTTYTIATTIISGYLPLIAGSFIWRSKSEKDELSTDNRAYRNLANELNVVASKSEVVINAIGDGVIAIDNQGIIQLINPAAQQIIGWGKQDAMALNYKSVLKLVNQKDEALDATNDPIQQSLNINQQIRTNNLTLMTNSDKKIMISLVVSPIGEVGSGVIIVFHDITKEKAEEREQAEFISTASHEMRTPVASIEGYLGLALNPQTATVDKRASDYILKAHASAQHLGHLFADLLDVSKADDGRISNNPKVVDIVLFLHEILQGLEQKAIDKGLRLIYKPMPEGTREKHITPVYSVNLDNDHIREIINNLVDNAIKYTPTGEVVVDIEGDEDHVVISIKDSGIGIPVEDMPHLFQKFYRVDDKNTRQIGGTGLGLYLCRRLAEIMGGRIWAESVYNSGSTFFVELPRISNHEANLLLEQEAFKAQQESNQIAMSQTIEAPVIINRDIAQPATQIAPLPSSSKATIQPIAPTAYVAQKTVAQPQPNKVMTETTHPVPRNQALTPEQIAAYVTRQRALAMQQAKPQLGVRPQSVSIPNRELTK